MGIPTEVFLLIVLLQFYTLYTFSSSSQSLFQMRTIRPHAQQRLMSSQTATVETG